jgi:hypothetical protein
LGGCRVDLHLTQAIDAEAELDIRPNAEPPAPEQRAEHRAALVRIAGLKRLGRDSS